MTNRDLFNRHLRKKVEDQLQYFESLSDEQLAHCNTQIEVNVNTELRHFKDDKSKCIGSDADILTWLASELWIPNEGEFIVTYFDNDRWSGEFARVMSVDRLNKIVLLYCFLVFRSEIALCDKFFLTPIKSPDEMPFSVIQNGLSSSTSYALANHEQLEICYKALSKTKELALNHDFDEFFNISHLSSDVLVWHIKEFCNPNSISNKTLEILNLLLETK